jgi:hypothetical protein
MFPFFPGRFRRMLSLLLLYAIQLLSAPHFSFDYLWIEQVYGACGDGNSDYCCRVILRLHATPFLSIFKYRRYRHAESDVLGFFNASIPTCLAKED